MAINAASRMSMASAARCKLFDSGRRGYRNQALPQSHARIGACPRLSP